MDTVLDELQCPVCLELFTAPTVLPCAHVLCRSPCAERLFEHGFVRCPVCRDRSFVTGGIQSLPRVLSLENIIECCRGRETGGSPEEEVSEEDQCGEGDIACQLCEGSPRRARKSCLDCNASYCGGCLKVSHPGREPFSRHQLVEPRRYPKPRELRCPQHDMRVNIYCGDCECLGCLLCADDKDGHTGHRIMSLEQAAASLKGTIEEGLSKLERSRDLLSDSMTALRTRQANLQTKVEARRAQIEDQCRSLMAEVELKQEFFLSDLAYEEQVKAELSDKHLDECRAGGVNLQSLQHFAQEVLKETDTCAFIQLAKKATEKLKKTIVACEALSLNAPVTELSHKVVDLRRERGLLRGMEYLSAPSKPTVAVSKCARSTNRVVLILSPGSCETEIVDGYQVFFCSEAEERVGDQHSTVHKTSLQGRWSFRSASDPACTCLVQESLSPDTMYYFCVQAFNEAGSSDTSNIITCHTRGEGPSPVPVPTISLGQCRSYTFSVQIFSESPTNTEEPSGISHYLLYRESSPEKVWKGLQMQTRPNHSVFGLEADTTYDFVVMACNGEEECAFSDPVTLRTERDS